MPSVFHLPQTNCSVSFPSCSFLNVHPLVIIFFLFTQSPLLFFNWLLPFSLWRCLICLPCHRDRNKILSRSRVTHSPILRVYPLFCPLSFLKALLTLPCSQFHYNLIPFVFIVLSPKDTSNLHIFRSDNNFPFFSMETHWILLYSRTPFQAQVSEIFLSFPL